MLRLYRLLTLPAWLILMTVGRLFRRVRENIAVRVGWEGRLRSELESLPPARATVWIHCASMGEFEAIRPLARGLRALGLRVAISFFSTSGPRHLMGEVEADIVCYLPFDTPRAAQRFIRLLRPALAVVTKHDLWPNVLLEARRQGARLWFINANFHSRSRLAMPWLRPFHRELLAQFDWIATVGPDMAARFTRLLAAGTVPVEALGDSRFDRVVERARESRSAELLPAAFLSGDPLLVAGSTWEPDEAMLLAAVAGLWEGLPSLKVVLVPHEPREAHLQHLETQVRGLGLASCRLSSLAQCPWSGQPVLIVDRVGLLAGMYKVATVAWVGGGFTTGVHSVIEPAAFGLPVLFGPRHHVSQEAQDLLDCGGAVSLTGPAMAAQWLERLFMLDEPRRRMAEASLGLVARRTGVTALLLARIALLLQPARGAAD